MPITKSAKKQLRQNPKKKAQNDAKKMEMKKLMKQALILAQDKKTEELSKLVPNLYKAIDKACKTGVIKKNTASRKKSLIGKKLSALTK
ncbi:MAG TPA: 30S ribosomal protein S20 [Candidatus Pacearchaeota archaeon]|jgi:small subunit ribosomal protein S20|nr:30S ribosomal protein S20 [Candidatus Pacearchaeota archaeon]HRR94831.1 30S ribosomal protein S20 [Candidatus Paceibacterota bacterium]HPC30620.1 30S ribosomal protein S20 [Candidatus Pacearchaeota archaeon]HQG09364.1 30S ribosomal protein S20 [Candidatus Pacearchaeota archaeon]HQH20233.1 30S ribosomal protein S20 [Candidatus Pacearchaeota archaeon]